MTAILTDVAKPPRWELDLYIDEFDPRLLADMAEAEAAVSAFAARWRGRKDYLAHPVVLRTALDEMEALLRTVGTGQRPQYYVGLRRSMDEGNEVLKGLEQRINLRNAKAKAEISFFLLSVGTIEPAVQEQMLSAPELETYWIMLKERFAMAKHKFSEETSRVVDSVMPQATTAWIALVKDLLSEQSRQIHVRGELVTVPYSALDEYLGDTDTGDEARAAITSVHRAVATAAAHEINAVFTTYMNVSGQQGFSGPDVDTYTSDGLEATSVEAMLNAVQDRFGDVEAYYRFKARLCGFNQFNYFCRNISYGDVPTDFTWEEAVEVVRQTYARLDPWFASQFDQALATGRIDAEPRDGKIGSAFCDSALISLPSYLMMSFNGSFQDVETLGHEVFHYMSNVLMQLNCNAFTYGTCYPLGEVASIFAELFLADEMLQGAGDEARLVALMKRLDRGVESIFRHTAAMRFEQALYREIKERGFLPARAINSLFREHMGRYLGDSVVFQEGMELEWISWRHLRKQFYNYSYVFAGLIARAMYAKVVADPSYISEVMRFMAAGTSQSPADLLASMGMDINSIDFWQTGLDEWTSSFNEAKELAAKLGYLVQTS